MINIIIDIFNTQNKNISLRNPSVFKFETNAKSFVILFNVRDKIIGNFPHVGISAREGLLVMYRKKGGYWFNFDVYARENEVHISMDHFIRDNSIYEVLIYGPILSKLTELKIEIEDGVYFNLLGNEYNKKILIGGGLQSFGIGCTTVGTMFSNILGRQHDYMVNHITFNDSNYLDKIQNIHLPIKKNYYDIGILELDYINQKDDIVDNSLLNVINIMKYQCDLLIGWFTLPKNKNYKKERIFEILNDEIKNNSIIICDFSKIHQEFNDICTYSDNFINDSGNIFIYKNLSKIIGGCL